MSWHVTTLTPCGACRVDTSWRDALHFFLVQLKLSTQHFKSVAVLHFGLAHLGLRSCRIELYPEIFSSHRLRKFCTTTCDHSTDCTSAQNSLTQIVTDSNRTVRCNWWRLVLGSFAFYHLHGKIRNFRTPDGSAAFQTAALLKVDSASTSISRNLSTCHLMALMSTCKTLAVQCFGILPKSCSASAWV
jgi:hypothetical protein